MIFAGAAAASLLGGCATRWEPQAGEGPVTFEHACSGRVAPAVADFGRAGVRAAYHFVTQGASDVERGALSRRAALQGFGVAPITVNLNGLDTVFVTGPNILRTQSEVDAQFVAACGLGRGPIYLTHVRHNSADSDGEQVRVK
jgi:hypothetical protein